MTTRSKSGAEALTGHRERLRLRLQKEPLSLADYEILEMILGLALLRRDTKPLAHKLMEQFGSIRAAIDAAPDELAKIDGFGPGLQSLWRLLREVMARYVASPLQMRETLASPEAVAAMAKQRLGALPHEESWLALVDAQNRLISWERLQKGAISSVALTPRDILATALLQKASGLILVHNHPGGNPRPSRSDRKITAELDELAPRLGLRLLDHVIVTDGDCYSISQNKILPYTGAANGRR